MLFIILIIIIILINLHVTYFRAILTTSPHHTTGQIVHYDDGVVLSVSTRDPGISSQLYSNVDTSAAFNIGRALAQKCLNSGIKNSIKAIDDQSYERSSRVSKTIIMKKQLMIERQLSDCDWEMVFFVL